MMEKIRQVLFFHGYFEDFFEGLSEGAKEKVESIIFLITVAEMIPVKYFKRVVGYDGLYEIRVQYEGDAYRIFCCFGEGNSIVIMNGFKKKSRKTPKRELARAVRIRNELIRSK